MRYACVRAALVTCLFCLTARADEIRLKDGTVIEGGVVKQANRYWVDPDNGSGSRFIPFDQVVSIRKGPSPEKAAKDAFWEAMKKARSIESPLLGVVLWEKFLAGHPDDLVTRDAKEQHAMWQSRVDSGAELINGLWVGGAECRVARDTCQKLMNEGVALTEANKTLAAIKKFEEAAKIYPHNYKLNFYLAYYKEMANEDFAAGIYYQRCLKLQPDSKECLNNYGIVLWVQRRYSDAMDHFLRAAESGDSAGIAANLLKAVQAWPHVAQPDPKSRVKRPPATYARMSQASEAAKLLAVTYNMDLRLDRTQQPWFVIRAPTEGGSDRTPGIVSGGSGFIVDGSGLIVTNHHVVHSAGSIIVRLDDGTRLVGETVASDEAKDLAVIRVRSTKKLPTVGLGGNTKQLKDGARCVVLGYPLLFKLGTTLKVTQGIVAGKNNRGDAGDIMLDVKVNPGNSGGPLMNESGEVVGVVQAKLSVAQGQDSYGFAVSNERLEEFLRKHHVEFRRGDGKQSKMSAEEITQANRAATVCILIVGN